MTGCFPQPTKGCPGELMGHPSAAVSVPIPVSRALADATISNTDRHGPGAPYLGQEQIKPLFYQIADWYSGPRIFKNKKILIFQVKNLDENVL